jgi:hypothetical protein
LVKTAGYPVILNRLLTGQPVFFVVAIFNFFYPKQDQQCGLGYATKLPRLETAHHHDPK